MGVDISDHIGQSPGQPWKGQSTFWPDTNGVAR